MCCIHWAFQPNITEGAWVWVLSNYAKPDKLQSLTVDHNDSVSWSLVVYHWKIFSSPTSSFKHLQSCFLKHFSHSAEFHKNNHELVNHPAHLCASSPDMFAYIWLTHRFNLQETKDTIYLWVAYLGILINIQIGSSDLSYNCLCRRIFRYPDIFRELQEYWSIVIGIQNSHPDL